MSLPTYPWFDQVPDHLKTRNQLAEQGLRPGGPVVAQVVWKRGKRWADLYDLNHAKPKQEATAAQLAALEAAQRARRTCPTCGTVFDFVLPYRFDCPECDYRSRAGDRADAATRAAKLLARSDAVALDTETTDLDGYLVEIAITDLSGAPLLNTRLNPQTEIHASHIHGITAAMVADCPTFRDIEPQIAALLHEKRVIVYNAPFDRGILRNELWRLYAGPDGGSQGASEQVEAWVKRCHWRCAMRLYAQWVGDWSSYHGSYRWQPLSGGDHSALGDCRACLDTLRRMAGDMTEERGSQ